MKKHYRIFETVDEQGRPAFRVEYRVLFVWVRWFHTKHSTDGSARVTYERSLWHTQQEAVEAIYSANENPNKQFKHIPHVDKLVKTIIIK